MTAPTWVEALLNGDRRTWRRFRTTTPDARPSHTGTATAAQLEVARRLIVANPQLPGLSTLVGLVLTTSAVGRGAVDVPPPSSADARSWGSPPLEPEEVPTAELLRAAVPVLARLLPPADAPAPPDDRPGAHRRLRARRFAVHGPPDVARVVAAALVAAGWLPGSFRATHLVLGCPVDAGVQQVWAARVGAGSVRGWRRTWRALHAADHIPVRLDTGPLAARVAETVAPARRHDRLQVVVGPDPATVAALALAAVGLGERVPALRPVPFDPAMVDLRRRLNVLTSLSGARDTGMLDTLVAPRRLRLTVPSAHRAWAGAQAARVAATVAEQARAGDYPVHGDPLSLTALQPASVASGVMPAATLDRALAAIAAAWSHHDGAHPRPDGGLNG